MLSIGKLRNKITIQQQVTERDSFGEPLQSWTAFANVKAEIQIGNGREFFAAKKNNAELSGIVKMRYKAGITPSMRVLYNNRFFDIISVFNVGERNLELELHVKELI